MSTPADTPQSNVTLLPGEGEGILSTPDGGQVHVRTFKRGEDVLLVAMTTIDERLENTTVAGAELQYKSLRGVIRLQGQASFESQSMIRFRPQGAAEIAQRREFVRVPTPQIVTLDTDQNTVQRASTVDLSGGGMLLSGIDGLEIHQTVGFKIALDDDQPALEGVARVVRARDDDRRAALEFEDIDEHDRQRLIRYVFECMRAARARTRGDAA
jgi:hypothetical protein